MSAASFLMHIFVTLIIAVVFYYILININPIPIQIGNQVYLIGGKESALSLPGLPGQNSTLLYPTTTIMQNYVPQNTIYAYVLTLINNNRQNASLENVSYINIGSAQEHSDSMLEYGYLSHWDIYGLKPYMRYTVFGGNGSVEENVAYIYNSSGINVLNALKEMEYSMIYDDEQCCNNGHRDNILDPNHNYVSIGVAYNRTTVYLTEDFINQYITWFYNTPSYNNGTMELKGATATNESLFEILVTYDDPIQPMSVAQLNMTRDYSYGNTIAGVGYTLGNSVVRYQDLDTINASTYTTQGNNFDVAFDMSSLIQQYGPGEYTILVWLNGNGQTNCQQNCNSFVGSTYTVFINQTGQAYVPSVYNVSGG